MTTYDPGTVVLIDYRFTSGVGGNQRPAVVLSCAGYHASKADAVIVPLTTATTNNYFGDYDLIDWAAAGLPAKSRAKGVIATIDRRTIKKSYGKLTQKDLDGIKDSIRRILEL